MNKIVLSFILTISLVGNSFCAAQPLTEQQKIAQFKEVVKTATEAATKVYPDRGLKTAAACGLGASITGMMGAFTVGKVANAAGVQNTKKPFSTESIITGNIGGMLGHAATFAPYLTWKQSRHNKKNILILERIIEHCAEHPEAVPAKLIETIAPLVTRYREHKKLSQSINACEILTTLTTALHGNVYQQAHTAATAAYPEISKKKALLLCAGITLPSITVIDKLIDIRFPRGLDGTVNLHAAIATLLSYISAGPISFMFYEKFLQHRESKKSRMIIEHLVKHFAEHQDELSDNQNVVFAPLITEFNAKKSLSIKNPDEILAEIQAVLSAAAQ